MFLLTLLGLFLTNRGWLVGLSGITFQVFFASSGHWLQSHLALNKPNPEFYQGECVHCASVSRFLGEVPVEQEGTHGRNEIIPSPLSTARTRWSPPSPGPPAPPLRTLGDPILGEISWLAICSDVSAEVGRRSKWGFPCKPELEGNIQISPCILESKQFPSCSSLCV